MLLTKLFILLFLAFTVDAQYRRPPPLRPIRPIPVRPAAQSNDVETELNPEPFPPTTEVPSAIIEDEIEVFDPSFQLPEKKPIVPRPVGINRRPSPRPQPPNLPLFKPIPNGPVSTAQPIQVNVTGDLTSSTPEVVIVYPDDNLFEPLNTSPPRYPPYSPNFSNPRPRPKPLSKPETPTYEPELESQLLSETETESPIFEPETKLQPSFETEPEPPIYQSEEEQEIPEAELLQPFYDPELPFYEPDVEPLPSPETEPESPDYEYESETNSSPEAESQPESPIYEPEVDIIAELELSDGSELNTHYSIGDDWSALEPEREFETDQQIKPKPELPESNPVPLLPEYPFPHPIPTPYPTPQSTPNGRPGLNRRPSLPSYFKPIYPNPIPEITTRSTVAPSKPYVPSKYPTPSKPIVGFVCEEANAYYPITKECDTYVECRRFVAWKQICPDGLLYNPKAYWPQYPCVYPSQVRCGNKTITQKPDPSGECPRRFGTFPSNTGDCGKYIVCHDGRRNLMSCPNGLAYNPRSSGCDWPENVPTCNPNVFQEFACPAPPKDQYGRMSEQVYNFRYRNSCKEYVACLKGEPRLLRCDPGLSFDQVTGRCINTNAVLNCRETSLKI